MLTRESETEKRNCGPPESGITLLIHPARARKRRCACGAINGGPTKMAEDVRLLHHSDDTSVFLSPLDARHPAVTTGAFGPSPSRLPTGCSVASRLVITLISPQPLGT